MKKLRRLQWKDSYSVGVDELDAQHKGLIETINKAIDVYENESSDIIGVFTALSEYLAIHFSSEENFMAALRYPGRKEHSGRHREFNTKFIELLDAYEKGVEKLPLKLLIFLRDWFLYHVVSKDDPGYAQYYRQLKEKKPARPG